ncbi:MAG TPA: hypothetical protein DCR48_02645 [Flavobacteriales bacterium]|nr:hypothetical protein [Flavobacteriales bacterium]
MDTSRIKHFTSLLEAQYYALFKTYMNRLTGDEFVVVAFDDGYKVVRKNDSEWERLPVESSIKDLSSLSAEDIENILFAEKSIEPFFTLIDSLMSLSPDTLSFLVDKKLPFELFIKLYLARQGYDKLGRDVSFEVAKNDWFENV